MDYLVELMQDKKNLAVFPKLFKHVDRLVDHEISQVRSSLFQFNFADGSLDLPDPIGEPVIMREKVFIPVDEFPDFNFVGRILGPRGMTAKQLEQDTGCKIMIRGKGSVRDRMRDSPRCRTKGDNAEENLHVLIQCEDAPNRARKRLQLAVKHVSNLLIPMQDGSDELKRKQLMELSLINGTYKPVRSPKSPLPLRPEETPFKLQSPPKRRPHQLTLSSSTTTSGSSFSRSISSQPATPINIVSPPPTNSVSSIGELTKSLSISPPQSSTGSSNCSSDSPRLSICQSILRSYLPGYFPPSPGFFETSRAQAFFGDDI